jgi:hypothetical protein
MNSGWPDNIGKTNRRGGYKVEDEIVEPQGDTKLVYVQKMRFKDGSLEYRFTYYVVAKKGTVLGRWVFANRSVFVPTEQLAKLLDKARVKKWEGFV